MIQSVSLGLTLVYPSTSSIGLDEMNSVTPPRPEADISARREQILQAARAAIEEHGPGALTGQIAERAGLARPNFYRHFASKGDLDFEVARGAYQELQAEIRSRLDLDGGTPLEVIRAPIAAQVTWADCHPNLYRFLVSRGHQRSSQRCKAERRDFATELAAAGSRYFPHFADNLDDAAAILAALIGLIDASVLWWLNRPTETVEQLIDRLAADAWLIVDHHLGKIGVHIDPTMPLPMGPGGPVGKRRPGTRGRSVEIDT
jgi:AcrR family transcriptional regulator